MPLHNRRGIQQAGEAAGPPGTIIEGSGESRNHRGNDWRAGGLAGRRYKCFDVIDVAVSGSSALRYTYVVSWCLRLIVTVTLLASACCRVAPPPFKSSPLAPKWSLSDVVKPRGVFLVLHGLNQDPRALDQLSCELTRLGFHAFRPVLAGHVEKTTESFAPELWLSDVKSAIETIQQRYPNLPISLLGYSLGGTLATLAASETNLSHRPHSMILIAPAISLRWPLDLLTYLTIVPHSTVGSPSLAPAGYRRFATTPLFWYANTLELYDRIDDSSSFRKLRSIPTLVLLNPEDELVSPSGTRAWIAGHDLQSTWTIQEVHQRPPERSFPAHLIIDEYSLGAAGWREMLLGIRSFLDSSADTKDEAPRSANSRIAQ